MKLYVEFCLIVPSERYTDPEGRLRCRPPRVMIYHRLLRLGPWSLWFMRRGMPWCTFSKFYEGHSRTLGLDTPLFCIALERKY